MVETKEVKILGAGVAGLTAAINLSQAGYKTTVFDRASDSGTRFSGDLQGLENWSRSENVIEEIKRMGIKPTFWHKAFTRLTATNCEKEINMKFKKPAFYLVKRGTMPESLDQHLKERALDAGVEVKFNRAVKEENVDIVATGPKPKVHVAVDRGIVFDTDIDDTAVILANDELAYKGYSYLLVADGYGCMCTVVFQDLSHVNAYWNKTKDHFEKTFGLKIKNPHTCGGIGSFMVKPKLKIGDRLYAGEAAGIQDMLWGFGMRSSITSGYLAAESLSKSDNYEKLVDKNIMGRVKASVVNRFLWEKMGRNNYRRILGSAKKSRDHLTFLGSMYNFSLKHRILYPFAVRSIKKKYGL